MCRGVHLSILPQISPFLTGSHVQGSELLVGNFKEVVSEVIKALDGDLLDEVRVGNADPGLGDAVAAPHQPVLPEVLLVQLDVVGLVDHEGLTARDKPRRDNRNPHLLQGSIVPSYVKNQPD